LCCHDGGEEGISIDDDDDGCSSCVEGDECSSYKLQEAAAADGVGEGRSEASGGVWWQHVAVAGVAGGGGTAFPPTPPAQEEDPKRAAERQEEDRKFWEDCLATGYP
jgi:hypothetical protein